MAADMVEGRMIMGLPPPKDAGEALADAILFAEDKEFDHLLTLLPEVRSMSLKERLKSKAHEWVRRESLTLPETGEVIQVRGMVMGEVNRINQAPKDAQEFVQVALSTEDPETGKPLWNPNSLDDLNEIRALPPMDVVKICERGNVLSGVSKEAEERGKENSETEKSSTISLVSASESPLPIYSTPSPENSIESTS